MFSKSCKYGIRAVIFIASESYRNHTPGIKEIAKEIDSPEAFTAKILRLLVKNKVIFSYKGPTGGFTINENLVADITLLDIVIAIDGDSIFKDCGLGLPKCLENSPCPAHNKFKIIRTQLKETLTSIRLEDLALGILKGDSFLKIN